MIKTQKAFSLIIPLTISLLLSVFAVAGEAPKIIRDKGGYRTEIISDYDVTSREKLELMQICGDVRVDSWKESKLRITEKIKINAYTQGEAEDRKSVV